MERFSKRDLKIRAGQVFDNNEALEELFVTTDGNCFSDAEKAAGHGLWLGGEKPLYFRRQEALNAYNIKQDEILAELVEETIKEGEKETLPEDPKNTNSTSNQETPSEDSKKTNSTSNQETPSEDPKKGSSTGKTDSKP